MAYAEAPAQRVGWWDHPFGRYRTRVAGRDEIVAFADGLLQADAYPDALPIGLQVAGAVEVTRIATGVSASLELFRRAADAGAQMLIVHHGLFWKSDTRRIGARERDRLKALFDADLSLVAYHLALDAHPDVGNNALLCRLLGLDDLEEFGRIGERTIGFIGRAEPPITLDELVARVRREVTPEPLVFADGPDAVARVAIISGAAAGELEAAADAGADCFITGEPREPVMAAAREAGIHFVAAGHYATEVFGVRVLGDLIAGRFGVEHVFIDLPNPI
jgi:dinuclear metal center YbgI/SA1388 family protein